MKDKLAYRKAVAEPGTVWHAAETGNLKELQACQMQGRELRGLPELVVLESRDPVLGATPLHTASEMGHADVVKVGAHAAKRRPRMDAIDAMRCCMSVVATMQRPWCSDWQ